MHSVAGQMSRVNTVTSLLKRFLSKDDRVESRPVSASNNPETGLRLGTSASSTSLAGGNKYPQQIGSMKISDQVIEEVDEQMTITSMRNKEDPRPTAQSLFAQPSSPVDVPGRVPPPAYERFISAQVHDESQSPFFPPGGVEDLLSSSAPAGNRMPSGSSLMPETMQQFDPKQFGSQDSAQEEELDSTTMPPDDFERLRQEREAARNARQKEKMARSISTQQGLVNQIELQELLSEALTNNPRSTSGNSSPTAEA